MLLWKRLKAQVFCALVLASTVASCSSRGHSSTWQVDILSADYVGDRISLSVRASYLGPKEHVKFPELWVKDEKYIRGIESISSKDTFASTVVDVLEWRLGTPRLLNTGDKPWPGFHAQFQ